MIRLFSSSGFMAACMVALIVGAFAWNAVERRAAYQDGFRAARLECAENAIKEAARREAERQADEEKIAEIEKRLLASNYRERAAQSVTEALAAVEQDKADADKSKNIGTCPPSISRRLRDAINRAGRG